MKAYRGSRVTPPLIPVLDEWPASRPGRFSPGETTPAVIELKAGSAPEPVWTLKNREKSTVRTGIRNTDRPTLLL